LRTRYGQIKVPALHFDGWYDIFIDGALENFNRLRHGAGSQFARDNQQLVVGPWLHIPWLQKVGQIDFGPQAANPIDTLQLRWFDRWLKGMQNGADHDPRVRIFVMGANRWRSAETWPLPGTHYRKLYLHSGGKANSVHGDGWLSADKPEDVGDDEAATDAFTYDPTDPVPSIGGRFQASVPGGPYDQRPLLGRPDVLVYTTAPLKKDVEVTGPITVTLYAASSARDTDFVAKLDDVYPDGTSMLIEYGVQRARYRDSETHPTLIEPGRTYRYNIHVWPTSNLFKAGHRIRIEISSSNFPMYDRNPNTGHAFAQDTALQIADQTIFHDDDHPSSVTLPIVEDEQDD
jgi:putative CocE/NonD family hydrolase